MSVLKTYGSDTTSFKPSRTFRIKNGRIEGFIDGMDAVLQSAELILSTERFRYPIFSGDYGAELEGLVGKRKSYVEGDIRRRIEEALSEDDRIRGIKNFSMSFERECILLKFTIVSDLGETERSMAIG